jgi:hypothetical protein
MRKPLAAAVLSLSLAVPALAQLPPECGTTQPLASPYVFILFDITGSQNHSAACTQAEYDAGQCSYVCSGTQCHTPLQGDHPGSKWTQTRQALYNVLSNLDGVNFGFATFSNQDALRVRAKHWLYQADNAGPVIPFGGVGAFPAAGSQEVFGLTWPCTAGASDGCSVSVPADLNDAWEVTRVRRLPKGGDAFNQTVDIYVRTGSSTVFRVRYAPVSGTLGGPLQTNVDTVRCTNSTCSTFSPIGSQSVTWTPVGDFLSWESASGTASRTQPYSYFNQPTAADLTAMNLCPAVTGNWEPNEDDAADRFVQSPSLSYSLKQPTDTTDPRGTFFFSGDVIPLDWLDPHQDDVLVRLAPNLAIDPFATPDFRTAAYFQDHAVPGENFLRLRSEAARPLVPFGLAALGRSVRAFRGWYDGCQGCSSLTGWNDEAEVQDPDWTCRRTHLLILTDNAEECGGGDPCAEASYLRSHANVTTSVIAVGMSLNTQINCIASNGRGERYYPSTRQQIEDALMDFFTNTVGVQP